MLVGKAASFFDVAFSFPIGDMKNEEKQTRNSLVGKILSKH